jgi:hypothetical protein
MLQFGIPTKLVRVTRMTMAGSTFQVRIQSEVTETVSPNKGLKQDELAPLLFNIAPENAIRNLPIDTNCTLIQPTHMI